MSFMNWMLKYVSHDKCYKHYFKEKILNFCFAISPANKSRLHVWALKVGLHHTVVNTLLHKCLSDLYQSR